MHAQCSSLTYVNNDEKISSTNAVNVSICTGNEETRATPQSQCLASKRVESNLFLLATLYLSVGIARASRQAATSATSLLEGARNIITAGIFHSKKRS